jgi:hypothetical protein
MVELAVVYLPGEESYWALEGPVDGRFIIRSMESGGTRSVDLISSGMWEIESYGRPVLWDTDNREVLFWDKDGLKRLPYKEFIRARKLWLDLYEHYSGLLGYYD